MSLPESGSHATGPFMTLRIDLLRRSLDKWEPAWLDMSQGKAWRGMCC